MIVVSLCRPSDAVSQCLLSYLGFSYLGRGLCLHGCSSKPQPAPYLGRGVAPLVHASALSVAATEPDILECEAKWALGRIIRNKASGGDGIPVELFHKCFP